MDYNAKVETFRDNEYPMLRETVYLDHAGTTLYAKSLMDKFAAEMTFNLFGNPHSVSPSSQRSTSRIEDIRLKVLQWFKADPSDYDVVFVANATAGIKLVVEALRSYHPDGFDYAYHYTSHTSLVGAREEAHNRICLEDHQVQQWLNGQCPLPLNDTPRPLLFAYPGQSNLDGRRQPLSWADTFRLSASVKGRKVLTLLDAASLVATSPLDLSEVETAPDFTVLSFYKTFGFPDLGALIVRRHAWPIFASRRYFGGGTVDMVACIQEQWHMSKSQHLHEVLEDGTLPVHSLLALDAAMDVHRTLFGSMVQVASHTAFLIDRLYNRLRRLRHHNNTPVCIIHSQDPSNAAFETGPIIAFNLRNHLNAWVSLAEFEKLAASKDINVRTGGACNPGGLASALNLQPWELKRNFSSGLRCGVESDITAGKPSGVIRLSVGAMSTIADVDLFVAFVDEFYRDRGESTLQEQHLPPVPSTRQYFVESIWVYPIKSCGGFQVPMATSWEVRPEGLAWDREWCLIHRGSRQVLSQKRHPRMCLIRPSLDFESGELRVVAMDPASNSPSREMRIPLSSNPALFQDLHGPMASTSSRVCGEEIYAMAYASSEIHEFFSDVLGVPCMLARFPPGGQGKSMRHSKATFQQHQIRPGSTPHGRIPGSFPAPPSPPDSDTESATRRILLANESPILAISLASLDELNSCILARGGAAVEPAVFRANIVIGTADSSGRAYEEDAWRRMRINRQEFAMLGSCRRCNMVCINQDTAHKSEEPFVTLAKTRRFNGRVFFGNHMAHCPANGDDVSRDAQFPTIKVGDVVEPDAG